MGGSSPSSFGPPPKNVIKKMGEAAILFTKTNAITVTTYRELPSFNNYCSGALYMIGREVC